MIKRLARYYDRLPPLVQILLIPAVEAYLLVRTLFRYRTTIKSLLRKRRIKAAHNFIRAKLLVREEGGVLLDPLFKRFPKLAPYPWSIEVEVTTRCNKKCIICEHTYWDEPSEEVSFEDFKKIVDQFPSLIWFNPTGEGSAFLNKDFLKMLQYLKSKSLFVFFNDEFDLVDEEIAKKLIEIGVDRIEVSADGATRETYEKIKIGCNFDKLTKNLKTLSRLKKEMNSPTPELCFHYIITTLNVHELPQFVELIHSLGGKDAFGKGSYVNFSGLLVFEQIKNFATEVPTEITQSVDKTAEKLNYPVVFTHPSHEKKPPISECVAWSEPYVLIGGYVVPCCGVLMSNKREFLRKHSFGNLLQKPFKEIWNSKRYKKFRELVPKKKGPVPIFCAGCRVYNTTERERKYGVSKEI